MREIKFRGKRIGSSVFTYGFLIGRDMVDSYKIYITPGPTYKEVNVDPGTVGQFTGLKDKNGKEIYEGDICNNDGGMTGEVVFHELAWMFRWRSGNYYPLGQWVEVISNIYSNPELLDSAK